MHRRRLLATILGVLSSLTLILGGCGTVQEEKDPSEAYLDTLEQGVLYVRHADYSVEPLYQPQNTISANSGRTQTPDTDRILWFKEDWEQIPTLMKGDALIYYSPEDFSEHFHWERFRDLGYTIGVRNLTYTDSGRICLVTDTSKKLTYPKGDTDGLNLFKDNTYVIIETLGATKIRKNSFEKTLSIYGTILGLAPDVTYGAEVYAGTLRYENEFTANVRVLGSCEMSETLDYEFVKGKIIEIIIPSDWNSGYYTLNDYGVFRYVNGAYWDENTDFNLLNENADYAIDWDGVPVGRLDNLKNNEESDNLEEEDGSFGEDVTNPDETIGSDGSVTYTYGGSGIDDDGRKYYTAEELAELPYKPLAPEDGTPFKYTINSSADGLDMTEETNGCYVSDTTGYYYFNIPSAGTWRLIVASVGSPMNSDYQMIIQTPDNRGYEIKNTGYIYDDIFEIETAGQCLLIIDTPVAEDENDVEDGSEKEHFTENFSFIIQNTKTGVTVNE